MKGIVSRRLDARRPGEALAAEDVDVEVVNGLGAGAGAAHCVK